MQSMDDVWVRAQIREVFVSGRYNCAMTVLHVLSQVFDIPLEAQTLSAAQCLPGAGGIGGLCGLVSGGLLFIGVWGGHHGVPRAKLSGITRGYVEGLRRRWGSLQCDMLRDRGCEQLAAQLLEFAIPYFQQACAPLLR